MSGSVNRILLVDDDTVTNLMHKRQIARHGLASEVDIATDGQSALDYLKRRADAGEPLPELIFLDINMPRMNGFEFLSAYGQLPERTRAGQRIVMVSTSTLRQDCSRAEADPFVETYETKPLTGEDLIRIVNRAKPQPSLTEARE